MIADNPRPVVDDVVAVFGDAERQSSRAAEWFITADGELRNTRRAEKFVDVGSGNTERITQTLCGRIGPRDVNTHIAETKFRNEIWRKNVR